MKLFSTSNRRILYSFLSVLFLFSYDLSAQSLIKGKVVEAGTKDPLIGASVSVENAYSGATTDLDGNFSFSTDQKFPLTLLITYTGYTNKKIEIAEASDNLEIELEFGVSLNQITVTAQLREQEVQEVPLALSIFNDEKLESFSNFNNLDDIAAYVPGLSNGGFEGGSVYSIRGISSNIFNNSIEGSVGIFVDGIFSGRLTAAGNEFLDIERIEVLKGPQGTLFGRNTSAGAISIISKKPSAKKDITLGLSAGNKGQLIGDYIVNIPFSDKFRMRLAGRYQKQDPLVKATDPFTNQESELGKIDLLTNRVSFLYLPSNTFSADLKLSYTKSDRGGNPAVSDDFDNEILALFQIPTHESRDPFVGEAYMNAPVKDKTTNFTSSLALKKNIKENLVFESITGYNTNKLDYSFDSDVTALNFSIIESIDEYSTFNQEFRLKGTSEKVDWLAAANVFYQNSDQENNLFGDDFILDQLFLSQFLPEPIGFEPNPFKEETLHSNKNFSSSVFADATWHLNEKLDLTMGMRYSYNKKEIRYTASLGSGQINQTFGLNILTFGEELGAADNTVSESWTAFQPRINLAYKFSDKVMGYGGYSRGYKPGGFSYYLLPVVKPETNNAYEVGLKTTFANGYLNIATFLYDYSNLQLEQFNGFFISVQNAADVRSLGLEAEGSISLGKNITIGGQVAYIDAEYLNFINPLEQDLSGNIPNYTPKWNYGLNAGFYKDIDRVGAFYLQVDYNYQSSMFTESENLEDFKTDVFKQMNIAAGIRGIANGRLDIGIFGQNITNQKYSPLKRDGFGFSYRYVSNPFLGGVTIRLNNILDW